ncbi:MAG: transglycosylase SLT domain-containing protein, partial [Candidatus Krumholzibacteria bacterium]|nr:transglycosylase SLT domain-containing protein [Candidatus Krumholzibacteria bacterium]
MFRTAPHVTMAAILLAVFLAPRASWAQDAARSTAGDNGVSEAGGGLKAAIASFNAGEWESVIAITGEPEKNPWLETYRIYIRSRSFRESGRRADERGELSGLFSDKDFISSMRGHHLFGVLLDSFVESSLEDTLWNVPQFICDGEWRSLSGENLLRIYIRGEDCGNVATGGIFLAEALKRDLGEEGKDILEELVAGMLNGNIALSREEAILVSRKTIRCRLYESAGKILSSLPAMGVPRWDIEFLKASLYERKKDLIPALSAYEEILHSDARTELKKDALLRIASLNGTLGHPAKSYDHHMAFADRYPEDARAEKSLDTAARIMIAECEWDKAIEAWETIRRRGPATYAGKAAMLGEAVLMRRLGRSVEAAGILRELLPGADRRLRAAILYWLYRTSADSSGSEEWKRTLLRDHPLSFYAKALVDAKACLDWDMGRETGSSAVDSMEAAEMARFASIDTLKDARSAMSDHPAWEGFRYFLDNGLLPEAGGCAASLSTLYRNDIRSMLMLFGETRRNGMTDLSTRLLSRNQALSKAGMPPGLLYPVAYAGLVGKAVEKYRVPPDLVLAVMREESSFDTRAVSGAGACGLMQLMRPTGEWIAGILKMGDAENVNLYDPEMSIEAGTWYLRFLLERNEGSFVGALAAYNAGAARM